MANPDQLSTNDPLMFKEQEITYNSLNRVDYFRLDNNELRFDYRPDTTKWRTRYYEDDQLQYTKYHFGNHEKIEYANGTTKNLFYIFGGSELTGIYTDTNGSGQMGYAITDHLGSIWALANEQGSFIEKYAYDPWGRRVNPDDWSLADNRNTFVTDRGFTLHEHYDQMQIINMVARLYDPLLGQFISVDPMADKYPGWGAYVYCMNNPLEYWDPDGEESLDYDEWLQDLIDSGEDIGDYSLIDLEEMFSAAWVDNFFDVDFLEDFSEDKEEAKKASSSGDEKPVKWAYTSSMSGDACGLSITVLGNFNDAGDALYNDGFSLGIIKNTEGTMGLYYTEFNAKPNGFTLGLSFDYTYIVNFKDNVFSPYRLDGGGRETTGSLGGVYGAAVSNDGLTRGPTYSAYSGSLGVGFGFSKWDTNTKVFVLPWTKK